MAGTEDKMAVDVPAGAEHEIDESLYSRQLYVLGRDAMKRMAQSNVLIVGLKGLGAEIAKNVTLAGVKSIALYDPSPAELSDLSSQFFLTEQDIGTPRAKATAAKLSELNQYVPVSVIEGAELSESTVAKFQVVVLTEADLETQVRINRFTHKNDIKFIATDIRGLFGSAFVDFGEKFQVFDPTGEEPQTGIISDIEPDGTVAALDETRHGLEDGDWVKFAEVEGIEALNDGEPREVEVTGPYTFRIGNVSHLGTYKRGGVFTQVKKPLEVKFEDLETQLAKPEHLITDFAKFDRPAQLHIGFLTLQAFRVKNSNALPRPYNQEDANQLLHLARNVAAEYPAILGEAEIDKKLLTQLSFQARGDFSPMAAVFGGLIAQEVLKACSGKFVPIRQWCYFDSLETLPSDAENPITEEDAAPRGSRYDGNYAIFGKKFMDKISNLKVFLVGSGAIGCEMIKNWALLGLGSGPDGKIIVTDNDSIEKSNLNRQFLFRPGDVGKQKSTVAAVAATRMNPDLQGKIEARGDKVGADTEDIFDDAFWSSLDFVTNALDNVDARTYVDRRCVFFRKPLLESGTLGTKGNVQVVYPDLTESYSSSQDPPEKSIPLCTLRSFPNKIDHTIAWAKSLFQGYFTDSVENVNLYLTQPSFVESTLKQSGDQKGILETIYSYLVSDRPLTFDECIVWARLEFEKKFADEIKQLLYNFPRDAVTSTGSPFWSGPKRAPTPLVFDTENENHFNFIVAAANLHAFNYGLKGTTDLDIYAKVLKEVKVPEFSPRSGVTIKVNDNDPEPDSSGMPDQDEIHKIIAKLPPPSSLAGFRLIPVEFEKDDDTNHHIDFITATSNLRALNYEIEPADKSKTKFIAGRIIPAIATTTSLVTGLVCLELPKVVDGANKKIEDFKNGFINLALPFFGFSEPIASGKLEYNDKKIDKIWGRFDIHDSEITLQGLLDKFKTAEGLEISMVSSGTTLLYASFHPASKRKDRLPMKLRELVESVSKKPIPAHVKTILFEVVTDDLQGEDVEVPYISLHL